MNDHTVYDRRITIINNINPNGTSDNALFIDQGFLIDGYPGDEAQAMVFVEFIAKPSIVICLEVSDQVMLQRLKSRGNFDDQPDAIAKRVAKWNDKTKPIAAAYNAFVINAERTANEIFADIEKAIS